MFTLRCTRRLLARVGDSPQTADAEPTTRLGDWYANLLYVGRRQLVIAMSDRTFLPVIVAAAPVGTLVDRLRSTVGDVLRGLGVLDATIANEVAAMGRFVVGKTRSRQVTGVMVDLGKALHFSGEDEHLVDVALRLAQTPCSPLYKTTVSPDRATCALFNVKPPP